MVRLRYWNRTSVTMEVVVKLAKFWPNKISLVKQKENDLRPAHSSGKPSNDGGMNYELLFIIVYNTVHLYRGMKLC